MSSSPGSVVACVKWVDLRPETDPSTGLPEPSRHSWGFSEADRAAVEVALRLGAEEDLEVVVVCAGPLDARPGLAELAASGASRAVLLEHGPETGPGTSGVVLAGLLGPRKLNARMVVCGDISTGRGSGSVPAVLAHHLGFAQALGLLEVSRHGSGIRAVRRLDGARREVLEVKGPVVLSVEGSVARLRRAPLSARTGSGTEAVEVVRASPHHSPTRPARVVPWRPPPRAVPAPAGEEAFARVVSLTGALSERTPPRTVEAEPRRAAELLLEQLSGWGYLAADDTQQDG
ncbi:MAG: mycofactocin-associated electron transfer flavoprotein beta subunit [Microthrixaceae bacterium]